MAAAVSKTESNTRRFVLLGKTGSGKSSLANTILACAKDVFKVYHTSTSGTTACQSEIKTINGREIQLIDTPGVFDTNPSCPDFSPEILNCMIECADGIHAFLLVLKVERFTKHELSVADVIGRQFSEKALKYTTVVFTQGDQLVEGVKIDEWLRDNEHLNKLVQKCGGRCHVFDNKYWNNSEHPYRNNQVQIEDLLKTIDKTVSENEGRCYTNENLKMVQEKLNQEIERLTAAPESARMSTPEIKKKAKENTFNSLWAKIGAGSGLLLALLGVVALLKR